MATAKTAAPRAAKSATEAFETFTTTSTETVRENIDRATAAMSEAQAFGKQNLEAWVASAAAAQKGFEALSARTVAFQKEALEKHVAMTKALMTSKSVQEFVEKQNDYAKTSFEAYVAELTTVSDLVQGVAKETLAPINDRVNAVGQFIQTNAVR
ncbi:MAG: TIGR01841 family phasin [Hyphomonadaceae bacterium]